MLDALGLYLIGIVAAGIPAPTLDTHLNAVSPSELPVNFQADLTPQLLTGRIAGQNETVNKPCLLAKTESPNAALVAVVLGVDSTHQTSACGGTFG